MAKGVGLRQCSLHLPNLVAHRLVILLKLRGGGFLLALVDAQDLWLQLRGQLLADGGE